MLVLLLKLLLKKNLEKENLNKNEIGREKFIEKVWKWKEQSGDIIINQLKKIRLFL